VIKGAGEHDVLLAKLASKIGVLPYEYVEILSCP
jgi:hypothetical protein